MSLQPSAADLLRALELDVDGPVRWGSPVSSRAAGIFVVETPDLRGQAPIDIVAVRKWLTLVPALMVDGEHPTETALAERLGSFWAPSHPLLYVGRTAKSLGPRVAALYATELGYRRPHPGGHWLKTLGDQSKLRLWWAETDAPEEYEDAIINAFVESLPDEVRERLSATGAVLPWANLESPTAGARQTGIEDSLLSQDATPQKSSNVKRSQKGARTTRPRKSSSGSAAPRSPRPTSVAAAKATAPKSQPTHLTAAGLEALKAELTDLTVVQRPQVIERVKNARELGDLRENADYEAARNEQSFLEGRVLALEEKIRTAMVIEAPTGNIVALGSTVRYELDGEAAALTIVGSTESDPAAGKISQASPVGKALMGHRTGDTIVVRTPAAEMRYRIVEIS